MPVRRQGKLLTTLAALVGLCAAGAGCQSSAVCQYDNSSGRYRPCTPAGAPVAIASIAGGATAHKPIFAARTPTTQEPALAANCDTCGVQILKPIPNNTGSSEIVPTAGQTPVAIEQPGIPAFSSESVSAPPPPRPMPGKKVSPKARPDKPDGLPPPRSVKRPEGTGYPELPPAAITHPISAPREFEKRAYSAYIIEPPDILIVDFRALDDENQPLSGTYLVRMDGTIGLGTMGHIFLAGRNLYDAKEIIARQIQLGRLPNKKIEDIKQALRVDVSNYNSKFYYVITDGGGYGAQVVRVACTGNETVLDALSQVQGLAAQADKKKIWIARATPGDHSHPTILPVDWCATAMRGSAATNYQIFPGDRLFVQSDAKIRATSFLEKFLAPFDRIFGTALLGTNVANQIKLLGNRTGNAVPVQNIGGSF